MHDFPKKCDHTTNCNQGKIQLLLMFDGTIFPSDITAFCDSLSVVPFAKTT